MVIKTDSTIGNTTNGSGNSNTTTEQNTDVGSKFESERQQYENRLSSASKVSGKIKREGSNYNPLGMKKVEIFNRRALKGLKDVNDQEYEQAVSEAPDAQNYEDYSGYLEARNEWVDKYNPVLGRSYYPAEIQNYEQGQDLISDIDTKAGIKAETDFNQALSSLNLTGALDQRQENVMNWAAGVSGNLAYEKNYEKFENLKKTGSINGELSALGLNLEQIKKDPNWKVEYYPGTNTVKSLIKPKTYEWTDRYKDNYRPQSISYNEYELNFDPSGKIISEKKYEAQKLGDDDYRYSGRSRTDLVDYSPILAENAIYNNGQINKIIHGDTFTKRKESSYDGDGSGRTEKDWEFYTPQVSNFKDGFIDNVDKFSITKISSDYSRSKKSGRSSSDIKYKAYLDKNIDYTEGKININPAPAYKKYISEINDSPVQQSSQTQQTSNVWRSQDKSKPYYGQMVTVINGKITTPTVKPWISQDPTKSYYGQSVTVNNGKIVPLNTNKIINQNNTNFVTPSRINQQVSNNQMSFNPNLSITGLNNQTKSNQQAVDFNIFRSNNKNNTVSNMFNPGKILGINISKNKINY